jgi:hypothetical protein
MKQAGEWAVAHRTEIYSCIANVAEGYTKAGYIAIIGEPGLIALGLFLGVQCGLGFA